MTLAESKTTHLEIASILIVAVLGFAGQAFGGAALQDEPGLSGPSHTPGAKFKECAGCPAMIVLPGGTFTMKAKSAIDGRKDDDPEGLKISAPAHSVTVKVFAVGVYDVTRDEYAAFVAATDRPSRGGCLTWTGDQWQKSLDRDWRQPGFQQTGRDPAVCVSAADAEAYVRWINAKVFGRNPPPDTRAGPYRLWTWEEAEYAGGGGTTSPYYWGAGIGRDKANYGADDCLPCNPGAAGADRWLHTSPVGAFPPNPFGLYDMAGNVWQWTQDCLRMTPHGLEWGPAEASKRCDGRVTFGGSWLASPQYLKTEEYIPQTATIGTTQTGFRLARDLE
jgi:formylglycine-generating enzyme required for sulfatase activity